MSATPLLSYKPETDYNPETECYMCMDSQRGEVPFIYTCSRAHDVCERCFEELEQRHLPCPLCREGEENPVVFQPAAGLPGLPAVLPPPIVFLGTDDNFNLPETIGLFILIIIVCIILLACLL